MVIVTVSGEVGDWLSQSSAQWPFSEILVEERWRWRCRSLSEAMAPVRFSPRMRSIGAGICAHQFGGSILRMRGEGCWAAAEMVRSRTAARVRREFMEGVLPAGLVWNGLRVFVARAAANAGLSTSPLRKFRPSLWVTKQDRWRE